MPRIDPPTKTVTRPARVGVLQQQPSAAVPTRASRAHVVDSDDWAFERQRLNTALENEIEPILSVLRWYVVRFGLGGGGTVATIALEILSETTVVALTKAREHELPIELVPWLLRIGLNVVKRRVAATAKLAHREPSAEGLASLHGDGLQSDVWDSFFDHNVTEPADGVVAKDEVSFSRVRRVSRCASISQMSPGL
jgi:hypothetical protein